MSYHAIIPAAGVGRRMGPSDCLPKSLRPVGGRPILLHALDALAARDVRHVTLIVGHARELLRSTVGSRHGGMRITYVVNDDYASTEHGWSVYLARDAWKRDRSPVIFMDADNVMDPALLDRLLASEGADTVMVDPLLDTTTRDEELVLGSEGRVTGFVRGRIESFPDCVGGFVGLNRFGPAFMLTLFDFMDDFFAVHGRSFKYERIFDRLLHATAMTPRYLDTGGLAWVNVNHVEELDTAERIVAACSAS